VKPKYSLYIFKKIKYSGAIAEELNFRQAAGNLYVVQFLISRILQSLKSSLGISRFERNLCPLNLIEYENMLLQENLLIALIIKLNL